MILFKRLLPTTVVRTSRILAGLLFLMTACIPIAIDAQQQEQWNAQETPIFDQIENSAQPS